MGKYAVIYADAPWKTKAGTPLVGYSLKDGKQIFNRGSNVSKPLAYPSMSVEEICNLPVKNISEDNAHLYFWVTNEYLPEAFKIIEAWGFKYSTTLVWCKKPMGGGLGGTFKITTEFLIFARRGSLKPLKKHVGTWHQIKRQYRNGAPSHSEKPDFFAELIELTSPGKKLEMFARRQRSGWDVFGNEVENSIIL